MSSDSSYIVVGSGNRVNFFVNLQLIQDTIKIAKETIAIAGLKGLNVTYPESLLPQAEQSFNHGDYKKAKKLASNAKIYAFEIEAESMQSSFVVSEANAIIEQEKAKGFDAGAAENLLIQAKQALYNRDHINALQLANQSKALAFDIDGDGVPNSDDFAPSINNSYIYSSAAIFLVGSVIALRTHQRLANERRKLKERERESKERMKQEILAKIDEITKR